MKTKHNFFDFQIIQLLPRASPSRAPQRGRSMLQGRDARIDPHQGIGSSLARICRDTRPHERAVGSEGMTGQKFLTADRYVQQTVFANGTTITVNFGKQLYFLADGGHLEPLEQRVR